MEHNLPVVITLQTLQTIACQIKKNGILVTFSKYLISTNNFSLFPYSTLNTSTLVFDK